MHDLLHVGNDRPAEGRAANAPQFHLRSVWVSVHRSGSEARRLLHLVSAAGARAGADHALRDADRGRAHRVLPGQHAEDHGGHPGAASVDLHERAAAVGAGRGRDAQAEQGVRRADGAHEAAERAGAVALGERAGGQEVAHGERAGQLALVLRPGDFRQGSLFLSFSESQVRQQAGMDRVRVTISGSAPLAKNVLLFLRCFLRGVIVEGYGATETAGPTTLQVGTDYDIGNVGGPLPCCDFKLVDVPEMGYLTSDREHNGIPCKGRGELMVRGYNITPGYFKAPELTEKAFDKDGFLATGDIAIILPNYAVQIIDRRKNFFKLAQGEYVAAEKLEIIYGGSPFISQIFVFGDSLQSYLIAMIVPEKEYVMKWAKGEYELKGRSFQEICNSKELYDAIRQDLKRLHDEAGLLGYERIEKFKIDSESWSVDNGMLTPTFKLVRKQLKTHYQGDIKALYGGLYGCLFYHGYEVGFPRG